MYAKVKRDIIDYNTNNQIDDSWDIRIKEYEVDSRAHMQLICK